MVLKLMRDGTPNTRKASYHVSESVNRFGGWGWEPLCIPVPGSFLRRELMTRVQSERSKLDLSGV